MKQCVIITKDGKPIGLLDLRTFGTTFEYNNFFKICEQNREKVKEEQAKEEAELNAKKNAYEKLINETKAWVARLQFERLLDIGEITLTENEYATFVSQFNGGDIDVSLPLPNEFLSLYMKLKGE